MKAILVVDVDEYIENYTATIWKKDPFSAGQYNYIGKYYLKPMPQKKEVEVNEIEDIMHIEYSIEDIYTNKYIADIRLAIDKLISLGWNICLEELKK